LVSLQRSGEDDNASFSGSSANGVLRRSTSLVDLIEEALSVVGDDFEDFADADFDFLDVNTEDDGEDEHRASLAARVRARRDAANGSRRGNAGPNSSSQ
jgi:hypothetical protein